MPNAAARSFTTFETRHGTCSIAWSDAGIAGFQLPAKSESDIRRWRARRAPDARPDQPGPAAAAVIAAAMRYFAGERIDFSDVAVDLGGQSAFFARVYQALRQVGYGKTTTYGALAKELGAGPEMAREVGMAMAANPVPLIIPCHRVLAAGGQIGGFSAPGGSDSKLRMLELEGVRVAHQGAFDF
jgi:methylated-DNA-[protein]-cysteine S-methyltransferase